MNNELIKLPKNSVYPYLVEGELDISVETGDVGDDDISSINIGELKINEGILPIEVHDHVIRSAKLSRNDLYISKKVKVTISGSTDYGVGQGISSTYMVVKIEL